MRRHRGSVAAVLSLVVLATDVAGAQRAPRAAGAIDGVVSDTSLRPLADVTVTIVGTDTRVVTGANGRFRLVAVAPGPYMLSLRRVGFEPASVRVQVAQDDTLRVSFTLEPAVASLDTVTVAAPAVSPRLAEVYERRKRGPGQFITQDQIERLNKVAASDLFRTFMGIRLTADGRFAESMRDRAKKCPIMAIVDGFAKYSDFGQLPSPQEIAAIEFYSGPSEIPLQFKSMVGNPVDPVHDPGGVSCGLILIWTRDGSPAVPPSMF